jgi:hypothetical protein
MARVTSRGRVVASNHAVSMRSESLVVCNGCGREFSAHTMPHYGLANDARWLYPLNVARAVRHADACRGRQCECMTEPDPITGQEKVLIHSGGCPEHPDA